MLRSLQTTDLELILPWRNLPAVRQAMYSQHEISLSEHQAWFERMQDDSCAKWFLYLDRSGVPTGVVYFTSVNAKQHTAFWGFYAKPDAIPGTGIRMELDALIMAFDYLRLSKICCEVLATNKTVLNMHRKVGFTQEGCFREQFFDGDNRVDVIRFGMLADEWPSRRDALQVRVAELEAISAHRAVTHATGRQTDRQTDREIDNTRS